MLGTEGARSALRCESSPVSLASGAGIDGLRCIVGAKLSCVAPGDARKDSCVAGMLWLWMEEPGAEIPGSKVTC